MTLILLDLVVILINKLAAASESLARERFLVTCAVLCFPVLAWVWLQGSHAQAGILSKQHLSLMGRC